MAIDMDEDPEKAKPTIIPPPVLSKPPPPPPSPLESVSSTSSYAPPPVGAGGGPVKLKIRDENEEAIISGTVVAPFNTRATAAVIDLVVAFGIMTALIMILPGFAAKLGWLASIGYIITRDSLPFLGGQSVGKKAMKIKVVTSDDKLLIGNWEAAAIRNAVLIIPFFGLVELFILLTREDKPGRGQRLGDEWAKTKVILAPDPLPEDGGV